MANRQKIYQVGTQGVEVLIDQFNKITQAIKQAEAAVKALNEQKLNVSGKAELEAINSALAEQAVIIATLTREKSRLLNETRILNTANGIEIISHKTNKDAIQAEAGSLTDLISKRQQLKTLLTGVNPNSAAVVSFDKQNLSVKEAFELLQRYNTQVKELTANFTKLATVQVEESKVEIGSLNDLIAKRQELKALVSNIAPTSGTLIDFQGSNLSFRQALDLLTTYNTKIKEQQLEQKKLEGIVRQEGQAEIGSLNEVITKREELIQLLRNTNLSANTTGIDFRGQNLSVQEAQKLLAQLNLEVKNLQTSERALADSERVEAGSLQDLINKRKELATLIKTTREGNLIQFDGKQLNFTQALNQVRDFDKQIQLLSARFKTTQSLGEQMTSGIAKGFASMKSQLSTLILTYTGWFAAFREVGSLVAENKKLSDSFADLQIRIHGSAGETQQLVDQLRKIDTRTSLTNLVDIANIVAKKGVPKEEIAALTKEFDKLNVVLGKEIGEPDTATASIIKLITVFNDDKHVTAQRVNEIGTALFKLTTSGVATGEFLVNFAERVGAVRGVTGLTLPSILGMGAALQQLGQKVELSSTAVTQLAVKLFTNIPKAAEAAKLSVSDFRKELDKSPFEALVKVAEGLKNLPTEELHARFEDLIDAFSDMGIKGQRIRAVFGDIATNAQFVRDRIRAATVSVEDFGKVADAATLKQNTFAATLDKIRKSFELAFTNKAVQATLAAVASLILVITNSLSIVIPALGLYAAAWTLANLSMLRARATLILMNAAMVISGAIETIQITITKAYAAALGVFGVSATRAAASVALLNIALKFLGIGALIATIALLVAGCERLRAGIDGTTAAFRRQQFQIQANNEIMQQAHEATAQQITQLDTLVSIINDSTVSWDSKRIAMQKLIDLNPAFQKAIQDNVIDLKILNKTLVDVKDNILLMAEAQASAELSAKKFANITAIKDLQFQIEQVAKLGKTLDTGTLTDFQKKIFDEIFKQGVAPVGGAKGVAFHFGTFLGGSDVTLDLSRVLGVLTDEATKAKEEFQAYQDINVDLQNQVNSAEVARQAATQKVFASTLADRVALAKKTTQSETELENLIKDLKAQRASLKEGTKELEQTKKDLEIFEKRLAEIQGRTKAGQGPKITPENITGLDLIDAQQKTALAEVKNKFNEMQKFDKVILTERKTFIDGMEQLDVQFNRIETTFRRLTFQEDIQRVNEEADINIKFTQQKIDFLSKQKDLNAREIQQLAEFKNELADFEKKRIDDIQAIRNREFTDRKEKLKIALDEEIEQLKAADEAAQADASLSFTERFQIHEDTLQKEFALLVKFGDDVDKLEKEFNQDSKANAKQRQKDQEAIWRDIMKSALAIFNAGIADIKAAGSTLDSEFRLGASQRIHDILLSGDSDIVKARKIIEEQRKLQHDQLANSVTTLQAEVEAYKLGARNKIKTQEEFLAKLAELKEKEDQLLQENIEKEKTKFDRFKDALKDFKDSFLEGVLGIKQYTKDAQGEAEKVKDAVAQSIAATKQAVDNIIQGFFETRKQQIEARRNARQEELDLQKDQALAQAQSEAEKDSIEKQFAKKKKDEDIKAAKAQKELALKELTINFAIAVIKAIAQYGLPLALLPIAAMTALYLTQRAQVQRQQFAKGGVIPKDGGEVQGRSHAQGGVKFREYEIEGKEVMIINKRTFRDERIYEMKGTAKQIASKLNEIGGGVAFRPGATISRKFEQGGLLGLSSPVPVFNSTTTTNNSNTSVDLNPLVNSIMTLAKEQSARLDRLEVNLDLNKLTKAQNKQAKQSKIGTL